jgi:hypothetical protein
VTSADSICAKAQLDFAATRKNIRIRQPSRITASSND